MTTSPPDLSSLRISRDAEPSRGSGRGLLVGGLVMLGLVAVVTATFVFVSKTRPLAVKSGTVVATGGGTASSAGITANGYVVAHTHASVSAKILGRLATLSVHEGSHVRTGEIIATIEGADYAAQLAVARTAEAQFDAQLKQAERDLKRAEELRRQNLTSDADLENAQTKLDVLRAQKASAHAESDLAAATYENTRVRAPFDGTVLRKDAEVGEIVAPSSAGGGLTRTAIVTMADLSALEVEVDVNEAYIAQIMNGQNARITLDAYPDTSFTGRVRQVVPTADRQKATVLVKVSILDHDPRILPEMGAKVLFVRDAGHAATAAPRRVMVPAAAVVKDVSGARVWVIDNGRVAAHKVDLGPTRDDVIEVRDGLSGGESVVLSPPAGLKDGTRVRVSGS
ncbi:MAG TPA: efflux RND transporter periplasmic adaptor subunit [Candidatus Saccharimonadaceae bacterium]|nr:efflux RND transporter periplasmic adaptor subunit [Candidatus Saccharimonadaceae bacterium]